MHGKARFFKLSLFLLRLAVRFSAKERVGMKQTNGRFFLKGLTK